jgi:copper(I)-binding protein
MPIPSTVAAGNNAAAGDVLVRNVFVLGPAPGQVIAAGGAAPLFVSLVNDGRAPDRLTQVTAAGVARSATIEGGGMDVPVGRIVPGGPVPRIMLDKLTGPLSGNGTVRVTLTFRHAGQVSVDAPVMAYTAPYTTFSPSPGPEATPPKS